MIILNGLPRHAAQAQAVDRLVRIIGVIQLECDAAIVAERLRRNSGGDRAQRTDDDSALVARKLTIYAERTRPLLEHYRNQGVAALAIPVSVETQPPDIASRLQTGAGLG